jgi:hypothetical protein
MTIPKGIFLIISLCLLDCFGVVSETQAPSADTTPYRVCLIKQDEYIVGGKRSIDALVISFTNGNGGVLPRCDILERTNRSVITNTPCGTWRNCLCLVKVSPEPGIAYIFNIATNGIVKCDATYYNLPSGPPGTNITLWGSYSVINTTEFLMHINGRLPKDRNDFFPTNKPPTSATH